MTCNRKHVLASWVLQLIAAVILFQTLFFKFTGAEESVYIFSTLGIEPWGRYAAGVSELIAALLLIMPRMAVLGALMSLGVISGALASHAIKLGIVVQNDSGLLFGLAITVFLCSIGILMLRRDEVRGLWTRVADHVMPRTENS